MKGNTFGRVAVTDTETDPPVVVLRYDKPEQAEWYLGWLREHGGTQARDKIDRGGYGIDVPEDMQ